MGLFLATASATFKPYAADLVYLTSDKRVLILII